MFWLVVVAAVGGLAGKLQGAEKNDASAYLPASAESTQELNLQEKFVSRNLNPAVVVYTRASGITHADVVKATADARASGRCGPGARPGHRAGHGPRPQGAGNRDRGPTWGTRANFAAFVANLKTTASHGSPGLSARVAGPAALGRGRDKDLQRHRRHAAVRHPGAWSSSCCCSPTGARCCGCCRSSPSGVALIVAEAVIYLLATARRADRQRAERRHPDRAGARRGHGLRAAAGRPLPGGTAAARGPARGDGGGPAPGRAGHPGQRRHGHRGHALPAGRPSPRTSPGWARWPRSASRSACSP